MKQKLLLFTLLFSSVIFTAKANESEPNDTRNTADVLALNGNQSGTIGTATDVDWYKVTTNADGKLNLTLDVSNGLNAYFTIYDNDGTTVLGSTYTAGTTSYSVDGLAVGTYYIQIYPYYAGQMPAYTLSNTLTAATPANDAEPDSTRAQALVLPLNGSKTGHIGYYYNNHRDSADWYKVTTTGDGRIRLTVSSANGQNVWAYLFDNDGKTQLDASYTSGTAVVVNKDGLAAGTYYIRINTYYTSEFAPYTLSDSLFTPTEPNDTEPDSTLAQALTLPLNGSKKGHINYFYNNHKDSVDWYKLITDADGRIRLTMKSGNGQNVWAYLFDKDGKTLLDAGYTAGTANVVNKDGLAAGTYYIRVNTYYTSEFVPYTLSDSLFTPTEPNDTEPDSTIAQAITLPLNGSKKGHINYYYNNHKDSVDWYKLVTDADGYIRLTMKSGNGQNVWAYLFDKDGTTLLDAGYTAGTANVVNKDGLSAGTYYIRVNTYYTGEFAPYTLSDSLFTYNANDVEPNKYAKQAKTLNSNLANNGHVNFYYNNMKDSVDWFKINYTGNSGTMSVTLNVLDHYYSGDKNTYMQIYEDTSASPLYSGYTSGSETANLSNLSKGYYYVKVYTYYPSGFSAYTITPTFTQTKAKIVTDSYDSTFSCDDNMISYQLSASHSPYTVQLYRFQEKYGNTKNSNNKSITFDNLPDGIYYATVYGDGATGPAKGISDTVEIMPVPQNTKTTTILKQQATLNWDTLPCADYFVVRYRLRGTENWTSVRTDGNVSSYKLQGLTPSTSYQWQVSAVDTQNNLSLKSANSDTRTFKTKDATGFAVVDNNEANNASAKTKQGLLTVAPNPASSFFTIRFNTAAVQDKVTATLYNINGKAVWTSGSLNADALNNKQVIVNQFGSGLYYLKITDAKGLVVGETKVSITK